MNPISKLIRMYKFCILKSERSEQLKIRYNKFVNSKRYYSLKDIGIINGMITDLTDVNQLDKTFDFIKKSKKYKICPLCHEELIELRHFTEGGSYCYAYICKSKKCDLKLKCG